MMKNCVRWSQALLTAFVISFLVVTSHAEAPAAGTSQPETVQPHPIIPQTAPQDLPVITPTPPDIDAQGYVLMDANSGAILASKEPNIKMQPASLTKLMTMYVISDALREGQIKLEDPVRISPEAWRVGGSKMFIKEGRKVTVKDLIDGIIVASGNDSCVAMAEYVAGTEETFVQMMNQTAIALGMKNSHFGDSTGLSMPNHYTTPLDLAILTRALINHFPEYYPWYKVKWITFNGIRQPNRNRLLWRDPYIDGLKTGHTQAAGFCLVASGVKNGMRLISVVMGSPSDAARTNGSQALFNWGFRFFESHKLYDKNVALQKSRVWYGQKAYVPLGLKHDLYVTIPRCEYKKITITMNLQNKIKAPVKQGDAFGEINVMLHNKPIATIPVVALENDPSGGMTRRLLDRISSIFK